MKLRVQCDHPGCDAWADLGWEDDGWYNVVSADDDEENPQPAGIGIDKSLSLPDGWGPENWLQGREVRCPKHR